MNKEKEAEVEEAKKLWAAPEMRDRNSNGDFVVTTINIPDMVKHEVNDDEEEEDEDSESEEENAPEEESKEEAKPKEKKLSKKE